MDDWKTTASKPWFNFILPFVGGRDDAFLARLKTLRLAAIGVLFEPETLFASLEFVNAEAATKWGKSITPPPGVKIDTTGEWVAVQWKGSFAEALRGLGK